MAKRTKDAEKTHCQACLSLSTGTGGTGDYYKKLQEK